MTKKIAEENARRRKERNIGKLPMIASQENNGQENMSLDNKFA